jgi:outer membrane protein
MEETYKLALAQSETLAQQGEYITQLQQAERLADAAFKPTLALIGSEYKKQNADATTSGYLTAAYSVFSGMRDYISVKAAAAKTGSAELTLDRARQQLYLTAAQAYLGLLEAQRELGIRRDEIDVDNQRITELQARADIGRSRTSEVVAAQTQLAQDKASYLGAGSSERLAQQVIKFLTGLSEDLAPQKLQRRPQIELQTYLDSAMNRPDVAASRKAYEAASYLAEVQDHNVWPTVTAAGDYYPLRNPMPTPGITDRWDATLTLSVPLYTGDSASAQRESAYAGKRSAALGVQLAERQALTDVRYAYDEFHYISLEADSLDDALKLARDNARLQQEDYKLGLVTNLDVLSALASVEQTRLALSQSRASQHLALITLETASGMETK